MSKPLKKRGALLKLIGTAILLISFIAQSSFYERSNERSTELATAMRDRQMIDKSALLQEVMYFSALTSEGKLGAVNASHLAATKASIAAKKVAMSFNVAVGVTTRGSDAEAQGRLKAAFAAANSVNDYASLSRYFSVTDAELGPYADLLNAQYQAERESRAQARNIYLLLYAFGVLVLLAGLYFDWRGAEE